MLAGVQFARRMAALGLFEVASPDVRPAEGERSSAALAARRLDIVARPLTGALNNAGVAAEHLFRPSYAP